MPNLNSALCPACGCCSNICPKGAISLKHDKHGFYKPVINSEKCVECKICEKHCPLNLDFSRNSFPHLKKPKCYSFQREGHSSLLSSSGGAFAYLAEYVVHNGGIVIGVAYGDNKLAKHIAVNNKKDLSALFKSKYMQSYVGTSPQICKRYLEEGKTVLFSGTSCQIAGLYSYLDFKDYPNLITIDLVCLDAPPSGIFKDYLDSEYGIDNVREYNFRDKINGWRDSKVRCECILNDGSVYHLNGDTSKFQNANIRRFLMGEMCEHCKFSTTPRVGDITLGDFWGIDVFWDMADNDYGVSLVLANSQKGDWFLHQTRMPIAEHPFEWSIPYNNLFSQRRYPNKNRNRFFSLYERFGFQKAYEYAVKNKYDICLIGCYRHKNYGSALTYYALYKFLKQQGLEVVISSQPMDSRIKPCSLSEIFLEDEYEVDDLAPLCKNRDELLNLNNLSDTFIVGSDQVWQYYQYKAFGSIFALDFVKSEKRKIAYSVSVGGSVWPGSQEEIDRFAFLVQRFDNISLREDSSLSLFENAFHSKATTCIDPVFLLSRDDYRFLSQKSKISIDQPYILAYFINIDDSKIKLANRLGQNLQRKVILVGDPRWGAKEFRKTKEEVTFLERVYVEDWLLLIEKSDAVITDSFHGICFSIIYHKDFIGLYRQPYDRFDFISCFLGLSACLYSTTIIDRIHAFNKVDFDGVDRILLEKKKSSIEWLNNSINSHHVKEYKMSYIEDFISNYNDIPKNKTSIRCFLSKKLPISMKKRIIRTKAFINALRVFYKNK